jgi:hypothetical protein
MKKAAPVLCLCAIAYFCSCNPIIPSQGPSEKDISAEFTSAPSGCGNFVVYKSNALQSKWIVIETFQDPLTFPTSFVTVTIDSSLHNYNVHYDYYSVNKDSRIQTNFMYCNDMIFPNDQIPDVWKAINGTLEIKRSEIDTTGFIHNYSVTVKLKGAHFVDSLKTDTIFIREMQFDTVQVGWLPG